MTVRFAAARPLVRSCPQVTRAANDNGADPGDALLRAALRHFGAHGLAAAGRARSECEAAFFAGDRERYRWWLEICRLLDRRMASELDRAAASRS